MLPLVDVEGSPGSREEIRELVYRYAAAADARDPSAMVRCFAPEGVMVAADGTAAGQAEIERRFAIFLSGELMGAQGSSTHLVGNVVVEISGATAKVWSQAIVVLAPAGAGQLHLRGIGYDDDCVNTPDGWRFQQRQHRLLWQAECPGGPVAPFLSSDPRPLPGDPGRQQVL
jgi:uncharacterized protein (TIGR02246 family)